MDVEEARDFMRSNHRAMLATVRRDGRPQMSPVLVGVDGEGRAIVSSSEGRAKVHNLRRDARAFLCVMNDRFFGRWITVEGRASVVSLPDAMEPLVDYYRRVSGEHPSWDEYREAMKRERRVLLRIDLERAGPGDSGGRRVAPRSRAT